MVGRHIIVDIKMSTYNINCTQWRNLLYDAAIIGNTTVLNIIDHIFSPIGYTCLILLSESHISIHTFPEKELVCLDIFTCNIYKNTYIKKIFDHIISNIDYIEYQQKDIERG